MMARFSPLMPLLIAAAIMITPPRMMLPPLMLRHCQRHVSMITPRHYDDIRHCCDKRRCYVAMRYCRRH